MIEEDRFCLLDEYKKPLTIANGGDVDFDKVNSALTQWADGLQSQEDRDNAPLDSVLALGACGITGTFWTTSWLCFAAFQADV